MFRLNSLRSRVIKCSAVVGSIVLTLMLTINLYSIEEQTNNQIESRIGYTRNAYQTALTMPLIEQNHAILRDILDIWEKSGDISYLVIMDAAGNRLASTGLPDDEPLPALGRNDSVHHVRFGITHAGQDGSVQYGLLTDHFSTAREKLILYNIIAALAGVALSSILLTLSSSHIVKPLINLSNAAERITAGDYEIELEATGVSELDTLVKHFKAMAMTVNSKISMLEWQAQHDTITDAYNRRAFEKRASELLDDSAIIDVTMLYIDLDQFKAINDSCGHSAGDILLSRVAHLLESSLSDAFVARIGGDEFGAIIPTKKGQGRRDVQKMAGAIIEGIANIHFEWEGQSYRVGASIGVASSSSLGNRSLRDLMIAADTACFSAKELGRNRSQTYHPNDDYFRQRREELRNVAQLDSMLAQNRFTLHYQRFSPLAGGRPPHAEILLRVRNPEGGFDIPVNIIHAAERYNLMPRIDHWVIKSACEQIAQWEKDKCETGIECFSINVSGASLSDEHFPDFVLDQIHASSVPPKRLCFEITESSAIANLKPALHFIESVRRAGAAVALDDFGSGLSSFGYLKCFQADYLKIDGAFISNIDTDSANFATVKAIVTLARAHGLRTVAEFVHSNSILQIIREIGVDYAQGFHCHMPEPLDDLTCRHAHV